jgi:hypothetical protein
MSLISICGKIIMEEINRRLLSALDTKSPNTARMISNWIYCLMICGLVNIEEFQARSILLLILQFKILTWKLITNTHGMGSLK